MPHASRSSRRVPHVVALLLTAVAPLAAQSYPNFESTQTRSVAVSPDGTRLFAVNTPDSRLAVFDLRDPTRPALLGEVQVGLEPVAVWAPNAREVWVACHLSDSVAVVDVPTLTAVATLPTSDEPADLVGVGGRVFVSCATHRQVLVFDQATRRQVGAVPVFCDEPRALAVSGGRVYVASARSGNATTTVHAEVAPPQPPPANPSLPPPPQVGLIVDSRDPAYVQQHNVQLVDWDVFEIDPQALQVTRQFAGVGTILLGMATDPTSGALWVSNTEARNLVRFEPALRGHVVDNRVTRITLGGAGTVTPFDLNPGIDYRVLPNPTALARAIAQPTGLAWSPNGAELFVAGFGTDRIAVLNRTGAVTARIEIGSTPGARVAPREKRGPRGLAHHPSRPLLYVLNRLSNTLAVVDTAARTQLREIGLVYDPTPVALKEGRGFLYDAKLGGNGTASCASCHIDGIHDGIAWDLGDPTGQMEPVVTTAGVRLHHPMKGPMLTQTLQGIRDQGALHWRGDKATFQDFNPAFRKLLGGPMLTGEDMDAFAAFVDTLTFPPNPNQLRDRSYVNTPATLSAHDGAVFFVTELFSPTHRCVDCHRLPTGTDRTIIAAADLQDSQAFKVTPLRSLYKRIPATDAAGRRTSGYGTIHDGSRADVIDMHNLQRSHLYDGSPKLQQYMLAFDTGLAPTVGWTHTLTAATRIDGLLGHWSLLEARAALGDCDVVLLGSLDGQPLDLVYRPGSRDYVADRAGAPPMTRAGIDGLVQAGRARFTLMGVMPGHGWRIALDRDLDGTLDGDEALLAFGDSPCGLLLRGNSAAERGNDQFALVMQGLPHFGPAVLLLTNRDEHRRWFGMELQVALQPAFPVAVQADGHGVALQALPIPDRPELAGVRLFAQAFAAMPCGETGLAASNAVRILIQ